MNQVSVVKTMMRSSLEGTTTLSQAWLGVRMSDPLQSKYSYCSSQSLLLDCFFSHLHFARCPNPATLEFRTEFALLCYLTAAAEEVQQSVPRESYWPLHPVEGTTLLQDDRSLACWGSFRSSVPPHTWGMSPIFSLLVKILLTVHRRGYTLKQDMKQRETGVRQKTTQTKAPRELL